MESWEKEIRLKERLVKQKAHITLPFAVTIRHLIAMLSYILHSFAIILHRDASGESNPTSLGWIL